ncbi:MAG: hypothetical protein LBD23_06100 [Oscillospiraceae bacterium]|nr:hypothetical protein [Oscillospiraceae bacterium]
MKDEKLIRRTLRGRIIVMPESAKEVHPGLEDAFLYIYRNDVSLDD